MKLIENMMSAVFEIRPLITQSFMQRLLRQQPVENAVIELNNLLATQSILTINSTDLAAIEQRYGLSLSQFMLNLEEFYAVYFNYQLTNQLLVGNGLAELNHLRTLFQLPSQSVEMIHNRIGEVAYRQRVEKAIVYGQVTAEDKAALLELQTVTSISSELAGAIFEKVCRAHLNQLVKQLSINARITPDEEQQLQRTVENLGIPLSAEEEQEIERFRRYWAVENKPLESIEVAIALQKSEVCYLHVGSVQWYEERATSRRNNYYDHYEFNRSFDLLDLQSNSLPTQKETFPILKRINIGELYLTNKRLIFEGTEKVTSVKLNTINTAKVYKQGISLNKLTGKDMLLLMSHDADILVLLIQRLQ
ncbi:hypothetical protein [Runella zeae]|uniref:hypothetical protein n=1 Tax=Runella zeae TaxID=94255 RepID=UPI0023539C45|nr:hypothetical protein [Runella zeae]